MGIAGGSRLVCMSFVALAATPARADIAPDDGTRFAEYGFRVDNLEAFPEYVVLAYPWSMSNGAPTYEHTEVEPGEVVSVGRRSDDPKLHAMRRADYAAWTASHPADADDYAPQRQALFESGKLMNCGVTVAPLHYVPSDYQGGVLDVFAALSIDAGGCKIVAVPEKSLRPSATQVSVTPPPQPQAAGCRMGEGVSGLAMLTLGLLGLRRRRRFARCP